jgi:hypothetical protein
MRLFTTELLASWGGVAHSVATGKIIQARLREVLNRRSAS